jgi:multidrug efflux system membrane fusion protein
VGTVTRKSVPVQLRGIGNVQAYSTVSVKTMVSGRLEQVHFREGQDLKKGSLLFKIDPRPFEAAVRQAEATLGRDIAQMEYAELQNQRYQELADRGVVAREQADRFRSNAEALRATVRADRAALQEAKIQLGYTSIHSPISGRAGDLLVKEGNVIKDNETELVTINRINPIYVAFSVPEQYLAEIKKYMAGNRLPVEAILPENPSRPERGILTFVDNRVNPATGTIQLKGMFENSDGRLWPGQFVDAVLTLATQPDAIVVPSQAVQEGQQGPYVFVVKADLTVESRPVVVRRRLNDESVVEGLKPGETVVTDGQLQLVPGAKVAVKNDESTTATQGKAQ